MILTEAKKQRLTSQMIDIAGGEKIEIEQIKGAIYIFSSELGTLRILKRYRDSSNVRQGYSENLQKFYVSIES